MASYLRKKYRNEIIPTKNEIDKFIESDTFKRKLKSLNFYCDMKNKRARYRSNKFPMFYIYTTLLTLNFRYSVSEIYKKIYNKYILCVDKK